MDAFSHNSRLPLATGCRTIGGRRTFLTSLGMAVVSAATVSSTAQAGQPLSYTDIQCYNALIYVAPGTKSLSLKRSLQLTYSDKKTPIRAKGLKLEIKAAESFTVKNKYRAISVSPSSAKTDANGVATFDFKIPLSGLSKGGDEIITIHMFFSGDASLGLGPSYPYNYTLTNWPTTVNLTLRYR